MNKNTYTLVITFMILIVVLAFVVKAKLETKKEDVGLKEPSIETVEVVLDDTSHVAFEEFQEQEQSAFESYKNTEVTAFEVFKEAEITDFKASQTKELADFEAYKIAELTAFENFEKNN